MQDPTAQEMRDFLHAKYAREEFNNFDIEEAIYWFAADYHHGQGSNLYSALCTSKFNPGCSSACSSDMAHDMYLDLIDNFVG